MTVALEKSVLHGLANLITVGLPGTQAYSRDLVAGVEGVSFPMKNAS